MWTEVDVMKINLSYTVISVLQQYVLSLLEPAVCDVGFTNDTLTHLQM